MRCLAAHKDVIWLTLSHRIELGPSADQPAIAEASSAALLRRLCPEFPFLSIGEIQSAPLLQLK